MVPDDGFCDPLALEDPAGARTPPTPPVVPSPPASPAPMRHRAMAHLRPVSIPALVSNMAGKDPTHNIADFDRHYMPDASSQPSPDASAGGNADSDDHRSELKLKADGIIRIITIIRYICIICMIRIICIIYILFIILFWQDG